MPSSLSLQTAYCDCLIGTFKITADQSALLSCDVVSAWPEFQLPARADHLTISEPSDNSPLLQAACAQLNDYFAGTRRQFDLPLRWQGTAFRQRVWRTLCDIPYGEVRSYGEIAAAVGQPKAARAVGQANHHNPFLIIVPCHRVIGQSGRLVGYGAGLALKAWLLAHEQGGGKTNITCIF
ncbi:methylated-DNA--[protein]-cysteine S-methyltransferase [Thioflexithrix psekupsensis]|uniref:Methylated-DNA--protein-cysteine methyltransferase n=1 Tax=Thioflexithrix psekupsensis TaxID=1570016 RepID=A0A251XBW4_9GAMM|nr:methylated-DNA--[protein]-cysteine S-methyltransferase [Thioflexithrix psekupsensis]OUD15405.1 hypothetical protein TPSD3_02430 [Thioflexithrix psekupsensis]